jgi:hypothetical protein
VLNKALKPRPVGAVPVLEPADADQVRIIAGLPFKQM